ncbi:hypothetical protein QL189_08940 [Cronobacter turicensis]|uniref:hypothetical protein n=1 Tax=Cronobacter turicensis TaxID=413502 RepID=UPI001DAEA4BC|nr:hypothetical protein [Cronobacter turicensis]EGT4490738.1 hypothetical protein [Cronobacter turicensis]MDI6417507.1 hypothetical protein [Cronobacter turicensis]MDI6464004.1 hypothetical protein [Cronobacter turicensis]MDI7673231.1 hypothetical protein [Cronobacter turicensis]
MDKYSDLDALILNSIGLAPKSFSDIYYGVDRDQKDVRQTCIELAGKDGAPTRVLDRRLQALRKKGLIVFIKGWRKVPVAE